jgi:FAD/FMN-containing dehydrogenase
MLESLTNLDGDIVIDETVLEKYSTDWSLFRIKPAGIAYPRNVEDIKKLVTWASANKKKYPDASLTVRAAGTDMTGGPLNSGLIVDTTKYMNRVISVTPYDWGLQQKSSSRHLYDTDIQTTGSGSKISLSNSSFQYPIAGKAIVRPGTMYRDFEKETLRYGLLMPCYPASRDICAVGGMVANNGAGERSLKYGQNKDFVSEVHAVLSDGKEYEVKPLTKKELDKKIAQHDFEGDVYKEKPITTKNSAGYLLWDVIQAPSVDAFVQGQGHFDLTKLFVGAQGTTGIITQITYKLVPAETRSDLLLIYVKDMKTVPELVKILQQSDLEMLEMYDDHTFKIGVKFFKDFLKDKGFFGAIRYALRFLPEVWMALTGGIPKLIVMAEFVSNNEEMLHIEAKIAQERITHLKLKTKIIKRDKGEEKFWDFRHDSFKLLTQHSTASRTAGAGTRTAPFIDDIAVNPEHLPEYLPKLIAILDEYKLVYTVAGHLGDGNFHIIPLMDMTLEENRKKIIEISDRVYTLALQYGATITAEHNDGIIRTPYLEQQFGSAMVALFAKVKRIFDPLNIFNPGKKVGMTKGDIERYMA